MAMTSRFLIRVIAKGKTILLINGGYHSRCVTTKVNMGLYSCAIGGCDEKTYRRSKDVKFYYLKNIKDAKVAKAWKDRILSTRADIRHRDDINDVAICSRHFPDGDKRNLPSIIPKQKIWPEKKQRRLIVRRKLSYQPTSTFTTTEERQHEQEDEICSNASSNSMNTDDSHGSPPLAKKLCLIRSSILKTPPKEVQEVERRRAEEIQQMSPSVKSIYDSRHGHKETEKSPPLSQKLKALKKKSELEPHGVITDTVKKKNNPKDELIKNLQHQLEEEKKKTSTLKIELEDTKKKLIFGIDRFKGDPMDFNFYTGLPDYLTFLSFCDLLQPEQHRVSSMYYNHKPVHESYVNIRGRDPALSLHNEIFLVLCRLKQGYRELDLAHRFDISQFTVSDIFSKWIKHMDHILSQLPLWAPKELIEKNMPKSFIDLGFEHTRCIIDCTELYIQQPSSNLVLQSVLFSTYKNHHTAKGLVGIAPHGPITFVSDLYVGSASDFDITKDCGLLKLLEPNDHVMADKGFEIQRLLDEIQVRVDHPPILRGVSQMNVEQEITTRRIARLRIHVERAIERIKNYRILSESFPYSQWRMLNSIWKICAILTHFQPPIIDDC